MEYSTRFLSSEVVVNKHKQSDFWWLEDSCAAPFPLFWSIFFLWCCKGIRCTHKNKFNGHNIILARGIKLNIMIIEANNETQKINSECKKIILNVKSYEEKNSDLISIILIFLHQNYHLEPKFWIGELFQICYHSLISSLPNEWLSWFYKSMICVFINVWIVPFY